MISILKSITFKWWQILIFKVALISFGILLGFAWPGFFEGWIPALLGIFAVSWVYLTFVWFHQAKK